MEKFRDKLKLNNFITAVCAFLLAAFCFIMAAAEAGLIPLTPAGDSHWQHMWRGFCVGAACGVLGVMIFGLVRSIRALQDEEKLKKLYVEENDERAVQIWTAARAMAMRTFLMLALAAGVVAGYFNMVVSITILACAVVLSVMGALFKVYYSIKF